MQCVERCLTLVHVALRFADDLQLVATPALMEGLVDVLLAAPRSTIWFPAIMHAAEAVQLLVVHPANTAPFYEVLHKQHSHVAEGTLESHVLVDLLTSITNTLQPAHRTPIISSGMRNIFPSKKDT